MLLNHGDINATVVMDWSDLNLEKGKMYVQREGSVESQQP